MQELSTTALTHFESVAMLCLFSYHSAAMPSKPNRVTPLALAVAHFLILCVLWPRNDIYYISQLKIVKIFGFHYFGIHESTAD